MTWFLESPWPTFFMALIALAALGVAFKNTGRAWLLGAMAGVIVVAGVMLLVERWVVTDFEEIELALDEAAAALAENDEERILACIAPDAEKMRRDAEGYLRSIHFDAARYNSLEVRFNFVRNPPTAVAEMVGRIEFSYGQLQSQPYVSPIVINFRRDGDRWLMTGYELRRLGDRAAPPRPF